MSKVKSAARAAWGVAISPEFKPVEVKFARAVAVAVIGALGVKFGIKVG